MRERSSAGRMPIGVPDPRWTTRSPTSALPGEMPMHPEQRPRSATQSTTTAPTISAMPGQTRSSEK